MLLELTPDGRCRLHTGLNHGTQASDVLLASVASSYGSTGAAMVLSGSGHDGAAGVAMKRAGAIVIAESPSTARYPWMPIAAARAGADLVLDIDEIGHVLSSIVAGAPLPKPRKSPAQAPVDDDVGFATYDVLDRLEPKFSTNRARPGASSPACARPSCTQAPGADGGDRRYAGDGGHGAAAGPGNHVSERNLLIRPPRKHPLVARI